jgi:hypothetical protein
VCGALPFESTDARKKVAEENFWKKFFKKLEKR